ncbi:carbonic anhydrase [Amylibacter sp. IMCC11727]|uniref:carbonic anhydrase n=1 Tax=Amylibacter sp. IMCC11727 TaxID=3039851 RepID=UPI00244DCB06|nr:carbonic anhydrase [Amylibacter sp. IMCC11727]WGI22169.1 carbonic anhydrase [Amylibacter sp. IMCC11727]
MKFAKPLPSSIANRYLGWRATTYEENQAWYTKLADEGQHPRGMIISCCDSRVHATSMFGADTGEYFMHRNIANLVPPYAPDKDYHGTSAAIEYAVNALRVVNLIVMGHTQCGGVLGCHAMCSGNAPELEKDSSFVGRWMDILRPGYERVVAEGGDEATQITALEKQAILVSLENLMTFPFVKERVESGELALHGVSIDIRSGDLQQYDADSNSFVPVRKN